jgi:uncharacterized protein YkwD
MRKHRASLFAAALLLAAATSSIGIPAKSLFADTSQPATQLEQSEIQMWRLINNDRTASPNASETRGRANPLVWDARLAAVARQHSEEMAENGFFSHQGLDGSLPYVRVSKAGIRWRASAENIAKYSDVAQAEAGFMNEPKFQHNHRGNILNPEYTHVGVGIARGPDGMLYITQEFADVF